MNLYFFKSFSLCLIFILSGSHQILNSQNFAEDIAPIIYKHCSNCHRDGEIGPFPMTNYNEVRDWGATIKFVTQSRYMPPWKPDPKYQQYQHENFLSDAQISKIAEWVDAGMPAGDMSKEPPFPNFPKGSQVGTPDLVLSFSQKYLHKGNGIDEYRYFVLPTGLTEDKDLIALEMRPGNTKIVHHTLFWTDVTGRARAEDAKSPEYGFVNGGSVTTGEQLPGYVPGQKPNVFSGSMGQKVPKGSDLVLQMHYAPTSADEYDSSTVNLFFSKEPVKRKVYSKILLPTDLVNGPFIIPANEKKKFHAVYTLPVKVSLLGIWPHCHMLGRDWEVYAELPDGSTTALIKIQDWDFNWQGGYYFQKLIVLPAGSKIHAYASYDNTEDNPSNPHQPPKLVTWGEGTADEMFYLPISYVFYQTGDESLILNTHDAEQDGFDSPLKTQLLGVFPNPVSDQIHIPFVLNADQQVQLNILNLDGKKIKTLWPKRKMMQGEQILHFGLAELQEGVYLVELVTSEGSQIHRFTKIQK